MTAHIGRQSFSILIAALAVLALAAGLFALPLQPAHAQEGSAPDKPRGLEATATQGQVVLTWDDPGDDSITGYVILRRVRVNDTGGDFDVLLADTETAALTYTDDTVAASLTYTYRIKAINEHGVSERSRWFHIETPAAPVPDRPRGLTATATYDSVMLTWDDPGDDSIDGYVILRRNRETTASGEFSELVADTGTAATGYSDDSVRANTQYTYRIKAINEYGVSERSRWLHIDTPPLPIVVSPPGDGSELWSGTLSVGASTHKGQPVTGYSVWNGTGALSGSTFEAGGRRVTLQVIMVLGAGEERSLYLGLSDRLEGEVSLRVGAEEYRLSDAEVVLGGGWVYEWGSTELSWEEGEEVEVSIVASGGEPEDEDSEPEGDEPGADEPGDTDQGEAALTGLSLSGVTELSFSGERTRYEAVRRGDAQSTTVSAVGDRDVAVLAVRSEGPLSFDGADADGGEVGHQARLSGSGQTLVLVVSSSADGGSERVYAVRVSEGSAQDSAGQTAARAFGASALRGPRSADTDATLSALSLSDAELTPAFAAGTHEYGVSVGADVESVTVTATASQSGAETLITPADADPDTAGHQVALGVGETTIIVVVRSADGSALESYVVTVTRAAPASDDASLSALSLSGVELSPAFSGGVYAYSASVAVDVDETTVTAEASDDKATVSIAPDDADDTTEGHQVALSEGANTITVTVTAGDGQTTQDYVVTVSRAGTPPSDAHLSGLELSGLELSPAFDSSVYAYTATAGADVSQVTVIATPRDHHEDLEVSPEDGDGLQVDITPGDAEPGLPEHQVALEVGLNTITITVTAKDGQTMQEYTVAVTRAGPSGDASLAGLSLEGLVLSPSFDSDTQSYTASAGAATARVTLVAEPVGPQAEVVISPDDADPDAAGWQIDLAAAEVGTEPAVTNIAIAVTSTDGTARKTYVLQVSRDAPAGSVVSMELPEGCTLDDLDGSGETPFRLWNDLCVSVYRTDPEHGAVNDLGWVGDSGHYYRLVLSGEGEVRLRVDGGTSSHLLIRTPDGEIIAHDGRHDEPSFYDARLTLTLDAGVYVIEVATHWRHHDRGYSLEYEGETILAFGGARLSSLELTSADMGVFKPTVAEYSRTIAADATETTVTAETHWDDASVTIEPADADPDAAGHQVSLDDAGGAVITITVTGMVASEQNVYTVTLTSEEQASKPSVISMELPHGCEIHHMDSSGKTPLQRWSDACDSLHQPDWRRAAHYYVLFLPSSSRLRLRVDGQASSNLFLRSADGKVIAQDAWPLDFSDSFNDSELARTLPRGIYVIEVASHWHHWNLGYKLSVDADSIAPLSTLLSRLDLTSVDPQRFNPLFYNYVWNVGPDVVQTTVTTQAYRSGSTVSISPEDADTNAAEHQVSLDDDGTTEIIVTVTHADGAAQTNYTVKLADSRVADSSSMVSMNLPEGCILESIDASGRSPFRLWTDACLSLYRTNPGQPAHYYALFLKSEGEVSLRVKSETPSHLLIRAADGEIISRDSRPNPTDFDARLSETLSRGIYVIEVAAHGELWNRGYELTVDGATIAPFDGLLASLELTSVDRHEFDPMVVDYVLAVPPTMTETTVVAQALRGGDTISISPEDADTNAAGHQVSLDDDGMTEIMITVTPSDGSEQLVYSVTLVRQDGTTVSAAVSMELPDGCALYDLDPSGETPFRRWSDKCISIYRTDPAYGAGNEPGFVGDSAHYYALLVDSEGEVRLRVDGRTSSHLIIRSADGEIIAHDGRHDNPQSYDARLTQTLSRGTYVIEVATHWHHWNRGYKLNYSGETVVPFNGHDLWRLELTSVDMEPFDSKVYEYVESVAADVTQTTVTAEQYGSSTVAAVTISLPDADSDTAGHQVALRENGVTEIAITVTPLDGGETNIYTVRINRESEQEGP